VNRETTESFYGAPVNQLLLLGEPHDNEWIDYTALGLSPENIPDLIRMATDGQLHNPPQDSALVWAPVHAWRALGQLGAVEAVAPLLSLFQQIDEGGDDWIQSDIPETLARIGVAALEPAANYLADATRGEWARIAAADTLGRIGTAHPDLRAQCITKLAAQLEKFPEQSENLNTFLISPLYDLGAVETMPLIERVHAAGRVDESVMGDVEDIQIHFGLKTKREHPPKPNRLTELYGDLGDLEEQRRLIERENAELRQLMDEPVFESAPEPYIAPPKIGRNEPCPCGSGKKYKKCCGA
jgi:SEC-C motif